MHLEHLLLAVHPWEVGACCPGPSRAAPVTPRARRNPSEQPLNYGQPELFPAASSQQGSAGQLWDGRDPRARTGGGNATAVMHKGQVAEGSGKASVHRQPPLAAGKALKRGVLGW